MMSKLQIIVEQHPDGFVAYPLGVQGVIVGQGDTKEAALEDVRSAIQFHVEIFDESVLENADTFYSSSRNHNSLTNQSGIHPHHPIAPTDDR